MKYLLLGCDPVGGLPLWDQFEGPASSWPVDIASDAKDALIDWNERMGTIVRTPEMHDPATLSALFKLLNAEGRLLADRLNEEMGGAVKVRFLPERD